MKKHNVKVSAQPCEVCGTQSEYDDDRYAPVRAGSAADRAGYGVAERICGRCWQRLVIESRN